MKFQRTVRVRYPLQTGRLVVRTDHDWNRDIEPDSVAEQGTLFTFTLRSDRPYLYFKACLRQGQQLHWAAGANTLALMFEPDLRVDHPYFFCEPKASFSAPITFASALLGRNHQMQVYLPPGYHENTLDRYRVIYMQDGQNLFFPESAFLGQSWDMNTTMELLDRMNAVDNFIVVGLSSPDRLAEYSRPGYETYARSVVEEVKPLVDRTFRTRPDKANTAVMGSSQGGVAAFYLAWQYPQTFVAGICLSGNFTYQDNLLERIYGEAARPVAFYLDSGWPDGHYEVNLAVATALVQRGWQLGRDLVHFSYPTETPWATRLHLPCQMFARSLREVSLQQHGSSISPGL